MTMSCPSLKNTAKPSFRCKRLDRKGLPALAMLALVAGLFSQIGCAGITASPGGPPSGGSSPVISLNPPSISFGSVIVGNSISQPIIIKNTGTASLTVSQATLTGQEFNMSGATFPMTLGVGEQASVTIGFSPTSASSATGSISVSSNASSSPVTVSLSGTGVAATHLLSASTSSISFGNVAEGTSLSQNVSLTNSGNSSVTISSVTTSGTGFSASGVNGGATLAPNQTATLSVTFDPTTTGGESGGVVVASNATNSPVSISLSGDGTSTSSESVGLKWDASSSSGVVGYNIYRGTTLGTYSRLSSSVSGTSYTDSSVVSGENITYYYVVTAVNSSGEESADSNSASVNVP
jgi:hypothetical protein